MNGEKYYPKNMDYLGNAVERCYPAPPVPVERRRSHVQEELDGIGGELERMDKLMQELQARLEGVRLPRPAPAIAQNCAQECSIVPLAAQLGRIRGRIGSFNEAIQTLCEEVEL